MPMSAPRPISDAEKRARHDRVVRIARSFGFVGRIEYRHVYSRAGGAQYGLATSAKSDLLIVYAEAFELDADPEEYSLEAIIAHERGHQILARHPRIAPSVSGRTSDVGEEILASLLGAMLCTDEVDQEMLFAKAMVEFMDRGNSPERAKQRLDELWDLLEAML
jgi:hypothetical protein